MSLTDAIGTRHEPVSMTVDRGRLRLFAKATGQTDPVYTDVDAARAAGHPDLLVPPTFVFGIELEQEDPFGWMTDLGIDMGSVLHGSQSFEYVAPAYAGDELTASSVVKDVQVKKGGALTFLDREITVRRGDETIALLLCTTVVRSAA